MQFSWTGPYGWPNYENGLPPLPEYGGVYLQTFSCRDGFILYYLGITGRTFRQRFLEHELAYLSSGYTIIDTYLAQIPSGLNRRGIPESLII